MFSFLPSIVCRNILSRMFPVSFQSGSLGMAGCAQVKHTSCIGEIFYLCILLGEFSQGNAKVMEGAPSFAVKNKIEAVMMAG